MAMSRPRIRLVLDFDGTITIEDTTAVIGSRCLAKARQLALPNLPEDQLPKPMQHYSEQYMQDYREWKKSQTSSSSEHKTIDDEVSYLSQSKHVEEASFLRVRNAVLGIPGGISEMERSETMRNEFMMDAGREAVRRGELRIRDPEALMKLIAKADHPGSVWGVVSVSWSQRFILGALIEAGLVSAEDEESVIRRIRCNELMAPDHRDREGVTNIICSARDKQDAFRKLLADWEGPAATQPRQYPSSSNDEHGLATIYVGDSSTDIGCLVDATIGIYFHSGDTEKDSTVQALKRLGIKPIDMTDLPNSNAPSTMNDVTANLRDEGKPLHLVCLARSFQEIDEWASKLFTNSS